MNRIERYPMPSPPPVQGINLWLPQAARCLRFNHYTEYQSIDWLRAWEPQLRRPYQAGEVERAVALVYGTTPQISARYHPPQRHRRKIVFDPIKLARLAAGLPEADEAWLWSRSPIDPDSRAPETYLHCLTNESERILCFQKFKSQGQFVWQNRGGLCLTHGPLHRWQRGLEDGAWFLPQPITGDGLELERLRSESNPKGWTRRAEECIASFRFALLESDEADAAQWLRTLVQLPIPIASIVTSGGKSIHALVQINAPSKAAWDEIARGFLLPLVAPLGADPAALTAVRLTRLPFVHRGDRPQRLLYLNSFPEAKPIANLPSIRNPHADLINPF
jgi:hypothetical protein